MFQVLYVDDEPELLQIGKIFLEGHGKFRVDTATSAPEAMTLLESGNYEAIVSDYQMPVMDGIAFLKKIRASGNTIPFIIFTGKGREEVVIQALNEGADSYLQKGGEANSQFAELAHKIRLVVEHRRADKKISDQERLQSDILNFLPDATFAINTEGIVIAWNRAMEKLTGTPASVMIGEGKYAYAVSLYGERRPLLIDLVLKNDPAIKTRYPFIKRNGNILYAEVTVPGFAGVRDALLWFTASPLYDNAGTMIGAIESIRDVTDRKIVRDSLQREKEFFDAVIDCIPNIFFVLDRDGKFIRTNRFMEESLGKSGEAIADMNALAFVVEEDRHAAEKAIREVFSSGSGEIRVHVRGKDNVVKDYRLRGSRLVVGDERYVVGTGVEVNPDNP
ncbi:response regulator [Methanoregula formicica]|uniref:PAS domain S-box n=1 Tax=Methanoregula formicica (strain DSM 22288 / NBRC 105244 / SMSP) TaxID=593750 RepID=L0HG51_METFS|nr:response regulator [Methanoregula formicica]AGB02756.1 PAS domain S-box [Methanoregula formicica SMSP]